MDDECPHAGASLSQGAVVGSRVRCSYHGAEYDRRGGCVVGRTGANQTFDVSEANGIVYIGPRGLGRADQVTLGTDIPFFAELAAGGFAPGLTVMQKDVIANHYELVYDNIISVEHLVGVHKMEPSRNQQNIGRDRVTFEQPIAPAARPFAGGDTLLCTIHMRPPFASFVEQRLPNGIVGQIFMFTVPTNDHNASQLITVYRQNFLDDAKVPFLPAQRWARRLLIKPVVDKAIREDKEIIEAQRHRRGQKLRPQVGPERAERVGAGGTAPQIRRVMVVGASGGTGRAVVDELLDTGHRVTAFVRDPRRLDRRHLRLQVVAGDVLNPAALDAAMAGHDAVVIALGGGRHSPADLCARGTKHIVAAMRAHEVRRVVAVTSFGLGNTRGAWQSFMGLPVERWLFQLAMGAMLRDKAGQEDVIRASGLAWTVLRPRQLVDGAQGRAVAREDGRSVGRRIGRSAVARLACQMLAARHCQGKSYALSADG